ncbi:MAG TPA: CPBP family intramembrane glutamic endopeptidase [Anaeromyxobacteraceae bacterium]|nr:CPBP family intramembrane glutamic endopeptidase [Anaeromyxobacteraceae bacterium]
MILAIRRVPILSFFLLAWLFSWVFMVPLALASRGLIAPLPGWLHYLSAYGPLLSGLVVIGATEGSPGLRAWWSRLSRWQAGVGPWTVALSPLPLYGIAAVSERLAHGAWPDPRLLGKLNFLPDIGLWSVVLWLLNSGLGEESGWRGYALPALQRRFGARVASVLVACGWMIWHVPAFFYLPSYAHLGVGSVLGFFLGITAGSFLLTWLSNASRGSTLLPVVWHALFNFTTAPPASGGVIAAVISTVVMVLGLGAIFWLEGDDGRPNRAS